ncbi:MAG: transcription antitermination factor NusB [Phycisphaeraceae bacterium]
MSKPKVSQISPARQAVIDTLTRQVRHEDEMPVLTLDVKKLTPRDAGLAVAIHRTCLQRWLTLRYLLKQCAHRWPRAMQPALEAAMISGAAQLLFMDKMPAHAVVHDSVEIVKRRVRRQTAAYANAVLRRIADLAAERHEHVGYQPSVTTLPWRDGYLKISRPLLPPLKELDRHRMVATSHPLMLTKRWREQFGTEVSLELLLHSLVNAPTIVRDAPDAPPPPAELAKPHEQAGFYVWQGDHDQLRSYLEASPTRWVQDPASAAPVGSTASLEPGIIVDYCAGMGTKTRQLALEHPKATIYASDPDPHRLAELERSFAGHPQVQVMEHGQLRGRVGEADLLVLDVPCSNTAVLARRLEARYRFNAETLESVTELQREIICESAATLRPGGHLLYSTCSLEPEENQQQAQFAAEHLDATVQHEQQLLPSGTGTAYHDGSYHALLTRRG